MGGSSFTFGFSGGGSLYKTLCNIKIKINKSSQVLYIIAKEMQQHLMQMQPMMAGYYPSNVTSDHIQQVFFFFPFVCYFYYIIFSLYLCCFYYIYILSMLFFETFIHVSLYFKRNQMKFSLVRAPETPLFCSLRLSQHI